jgi:hypothetical protein
MTSDLQLDPLREDQPANQPRVPPHHEAFVGT